MKAAALNLLWRANQSRVQHRLADARRDIAQAVEICRSDGTIADLAFALRRLGQIERDLQNLDAGRAHYDEAAAIYRERQDLLNLAHTLRHVADIHEDAGRPDLAAPLYDEALRLYRGMKGVRRGDLANAIRSMAIHKEHAGERDLALRLWAEARDLYASLDRPWRRLFRRSPNAGVVESSEHLARLAG